MIGKFSTDNGQTNRNISTHVTLNVPCEQPFHKLYLDSGKVVKKVWRRNIPFSLSVATAILGVRRNIPFGLSLIG